MNFWNFVKNEAAEDAPESATLRIDGDIVDDEDTWTYAWFGDPCAAPNAFRAQLAQYDGMPLNVWINSNGGSFIAATGIYNALKERKGGVTVKIDGIAASAASIIAMAGDTVEMGPTSLLMIHNPLSSVAGYAEDMRRCADTLDEVKDAIVNAYQLKTGRSRAKIAQMMDDETYMSARTAIREGFADAMLYTDKPEDSPTVNMNHARIINAANASIRALLDYWRVHNALPADGAGADGIREKLLLEIDLI